LIDVEVYKNNLQVIYYYAEKSLMRIIVSSNTEYIGDESFQEAQWKSWEMVRKYQPSRVLTNVQDLRYTIPPEMQEWTVKEIIARMIQLCVKRAAYIIPTDFYAQLSIEQLTDEIPELKFSKRFFIDEKQAIDWLCEE
jgi:hypothetical protein